MLKLFHINISQCDMQHVIILHKNILFFYPFQPPPQSALVSVAINVTKTVASLMGRLLSVSLLLFK
jgi:hypothetical protein